MPFDLCHWASVLSNQQRLILPKSPPERFFLFVKSKGYFSDINWSSWSIWPCQPLFKFPCRQPSTTSGSLGFHMTFLLVLLRLFSFSSGFVPQTFSLALHCLRDFILFPTLSWPCALMASRSTSHRWSHPVLTVWKPTGLLDISTSIFQRVLQPNVSRIYLIISYSFQVHSYPCVLCASE